MKNFTIGEVCQATIMATESGEYQLTKRGGGGTTDDLSEQGGSEQGSRTLKRVL